MNLVVNLYKEQSTIKGFEDSVRSLKSDIARELTSSPKKKDDLMKELRSEIQKTAAKKLEGNYSSDTVESQFYSCHEFVMYFSKKSEKLQVRHIGCFFIRHLSEDETAYNSRTETI